MKFNALKIMKYISLVVFLSVFAASAGRCESHVKGEIQQFSDNMVVAQVLKGGVLLLSRNDIVNHRKSWQDANDLIFLRMKNTRGIQKGEGFGGVWLKYRGTYRHGNLLVGYRDIPAFELPSKEEVKLAEYAEAQRREKAERLRQAEERRRAQQQADEERRKEILRHEQDLRQRIEDDKRQKQMIEEEARRREEEDRQREEDARRAEEERYPIEQNKRAEYAKEMLSKISFDIGSYFDIQNDLKRYIASMSVTEKKWENLKELQLKNDGLGMLRVAAGNEMKDYPDQSRIDSIIKDLKSAEFHVEIHFKHKPIDCGDFRVESVKLKSRTGVFSDFLTVGISAGVDEESLILTFSMAAGEELWPLLYFNPVRHGWVTCPDCEGNRKFSMECTECRGEGVYYTDPSRGIGGRVMGGKKRRCNKCNGTGEMKVDCEKCHGLGKIRQ